MIIKEKTEIEGYPDQERIKGGNQKMSHIDSPRSSDQGLIFVDRLYVVQSG